MVLPMQPVCAASKFNKVSKNNKNFCFSFSETTSFNKSDLFLEFSLSEEKSIIEEEYDELDDEYEYDDVDDSNISILFI